MEAIAKVKKLPLSPRKTRKIVDVIRNKSLLEAIEILRHLPHKPTIYLIKLLQSAMANLLYKNKEEKILKTSIHIKEIYVGQGSVLKRIQPRAQGRGFRIRKPTCHITVKVGTQSPPSKIEQVSTKNNLKTTAPSDTKTTNTTSSTKQQQQEEATTQSLDTTKKTSNKATPASSFTKTKAPQKPIKPTNSKKANTTQATKQQADKATTTKALKKTNAKTTSTPLSAKAKAPQKPSANQPAQQTTKTAQNSKQKQPSKKVASTQKPKQTNTRTSTTKNNSKPTSKPKNPSP